MQTNHFDILICKYHFIVTSCYYLRHPFGMSMTLLRLILICTFAGRWNTLNVILLEHRNQLLNTMGLDKTMGIGISRKSTGDATFCTVHGRVIVSKRIRENKSKSTKQVSQRSAFGSLGHFAKINAAWIDRHFDPAKYGTSRNQFMKLNAPIMAWLRDQPDLPSDDVSKMALAIEAGVTLYAGYGSVVMGTTFTATGDKLTAVISSSKEFVKGDIVEVQIVVSYKVKSSGGLSMTTSMVRNYEYVITEQDVASSSTEITLNESKIPQLATALKTPVNADRGSYVYAAALKSTDYKSASFFDGVSVSSRGDSESPDEI